MPAGKKIAGTIRGSCLCGQVRYEIRGSPQPMYHCHCGMCRKASGSAFATNMLVAAEDFSIVAGQSLLKAFESSPGERRHFCSACGSPIHGTARSRSGVVSVRCGSLDDAPGVRPALHIYVQHKAPWSGIHDRLDQYPEAPP